MKRLVIFIAYGFGIGKIPIIPATFGTLLLGIPVFLLTSYNQTLYLIITISITILGIKIASIASEASKINDDKRIVIDEVAGFLITMIGVPNSPFYILLGFFLFRFFDILKPPPLCYLQRLNKGFGIILDDVAAGIIGLIILHIIPI